MLAAAWRWIGQRPATLSDLRRLAKIAGPSSSRSPSTIADRRILALTDPASSYRSGASRVRQFVTASQAQQQATKPHLYLVLDDREEKYSIYKLNMESDLDEGHGSLETPLSLPETPLVLIGPPTIAQGAQFAALGSHIIATGHGVENSWLRRHGPRVTLTYDTRTDLLAVSKIFPKQLEFRYETAIAARNKLYVFESSTVNEGSNPFFNGGLHCLAADPSHNEKDWTWRRLSRSSRFAWSRTSDPPGFPFNPHTIAGHVVHPRIGTIYVSVGWPTWGTFSYGTGGRGRWQRRGQWQFPFKGKAHYDHTLGAWVEFHFDHTAHSGVGDGYLCACPVISCRESPKWKVGREKLFVDHPHWYHVDAKLVQMGEHGKYCLVERLLPKGADNVKSVLRLTMFIVKYDEGGELRTMVQQPSRFYKAPIYHLYFKFDMQAFWM